jgi:hypothetical protein
MTIPKEKIIFIVCQPTVAIYGIFKHIMTKSFGSICEFYKNMYYIKYVIEKIVVGSGRGLI